MKCGKLLLRPDISRAYWKGVDVGLTLGEYKIAHLLASNAGQYVTYRAIYDRLHYEGFIAGSGADGYRMNVRSAIKRIRNRFRALDPTFDETENYQGFGYCWNSQPKPTRGNRRLAPLKPSVPCDHGKARTPSQREMTN
jgi:two-component system response regulator ChvI